MKTKLWASLLFGLAAAQASAGDFSFHEAMPSGATLTILGIHGSVVASPSAGSEATVSARKTAERDDPEGVSVLVERPTQGSVTICVVFSGATTCAEPRNGKNDTRVDFTVSIPSSVRLVAHTVVGSIEGDHLGSNVVAKTVNGDIRLSTTGTCEAKSVNGSIRVQLGNLPAGQTTSFESVNGSVHLVLPGNVNASIEASTVNGNVDTDFAVSVLRNRTLRGQIGSGGPSLRVQTVNGAIEIRRAS